MTKIPIKFDGYKPINQQQMAKFIPASLGKIYTAPANIITCFFQPFHFPPFFNNFVIL